MSKEPGGQETATLRLACALPRGLLQVDLWLVISSSETCEGQLVSPFAKSALYVRRTVGERVIAMQRQEFQDWSNAMVAFDRGNLSADMERRQWFSGRSRITALLRLVGGGQGFDAVQVD